MPASSVAVRLARESNNAEGMLVMMLFVSLGAFVGVLAFAQVLGQNHRKFCLPQLR
jgi:hypothetical protein